MGKKVEIIHSFDNADKRRKTLCGIKEKDVKRHHYEGVKRHPDEGVLFKEIPSDRYALCLDCFAVVIDNLEATYIFREFLADQLASIHANTSDKVLQAKWSEFSTSLKGGRNED